MGVVTKMKFCAVLACGVKALHGSGGLSEQAR
jgi:hypothetical protein